jgi:hypothetical protein
VNPYTGEARIYLPENSWIDIKGLTPARLTDGDFFL